MLALTLLLAGVSYFAGNADVPLIDRDEPRYAVTSRAMVDSGDWIVPRFLDEVRTAKPVFIYWCQATAMKVFGPTVFAARLPSTLAILATVLMLALVARHVVGSTRAIWTVFIFATSLLTLWAAKTCLTDAVLALWITTCQLCLYAAWRGRASWWVVAIWAVAFGLAVLTKGPVVAGVQAMTIVMLLVMRFLTRCTRHRSLKPEPASFGKLLVFVLIALAVAGPWFYLVTQREPTFLQQAVSHDIVKRTTQGLENHVGPPGYHLVFTFVMFFPWSLLLPAALWQGWRRRRSLPTQFALAAVIGPWLMFEIVRGKLPHYMLPTYPFLAYLVADVLVRASRGRIKDLGDAPFRFTAIGWAGVLVAVGAGVALVPWWFDESIAVRVGASLAGAAIGLTGVIASRCFWKQRPLDAARVMGLGTLAFVVCATAAFAAQAQFLDVSRRVAEVLIREGATGPGAVQMIDYKEASLGFYQGGTIREENDNTLLLRGNEPSWPRWLVITDRIWEPVPQDVRDRWHVVETVSGFNLAKGKRVNVMVLRRLDPPTR
jgi:4-amino-4-deoxy-L-arabinose transferase-like glycosyltransferase